jgi:hypothetical protein
VRATDRERDEIRAYVEGQAREEVVHPEKAASELVGPVRHDIWDVHCVASHWWVVTNPTNLYDQADFKSRDVVLTFHIGLMSRVQYAQERDVPVAPEVAELLPGSWRRWQQAFEAYDSGDEAEAFQSVGVRLRECLVSFVGETRDDDLVPEGRQCVSQSQPDQDEHYPARGRRPSGRSAWPMRRPPVRNARPSSPPSPPLPRRTRPPPDAASTTPKETPHRTQSPQSQHARRPQDSKLAQRHRHRAVHPQLNHPKADSCLSLPEPAPSLDPAAEPMRRTPLLRRNTMHNRAASPPSCHALREVQSFSGTDASRPRAAHY